MSPTNNPQSATSSLLAEFQTSLKQMIKNLTLALNLIKSNENKSEENSNDSVENNLLPLRK